MKKFHINWKNTFLVLADIVLATYLVFAITSWNKPDEIISVCTKVNINIEDENENGFLNANEVKNLLTKRNIYPLSKRTDQVDTRGIEEELRSMPFVKTAQCYITQEGDVSISLTQRTPLIRVKAFNGADFYIDDAGGIMPNSQYTSDMIIVTGYVSKQYACKYITHLATTIMDNDFWNNQVEQINVLPDMSIELVPRVGNHIINIGALPVCKDSKKRAEVIKEYVENQFHRMDIFYRYGIKNAGWERYSYINLEFANQIVCTK